MHGPEQSPRDCLMGYNLQFGLNKISNSSYIDYGLTLLSIVVLTKA